jgi:uncharacterized protein (TIGR03083 family)
MADDVTLQAAVAAQYQALAETLALASEDSWNSASLCDGWRVREVVAHVTMPSRYAEDEFMAELERCAYDFTRISNEVAIRDAEASTDQLLADLRSEVLHQWLPPRGSYHDALNHVVVHSLDITVPLGMSRLASDETIRAILDGLTEGGVHARFGVELEGRRLEANDISWEYGSGDLLRGAAEDLALTLCGRRIPSGRLNGHPLRKTAPARHS